MTPEQEQLLKKSIATNEAVLKEVSLLNKVLSFKNTSVKKHQTAQDIANALMAETIIKNKHNRRN